MNDNITKASLERFWERVDSSGTCWEWRGQITAYGYGNFWTQGKNWRAHKFAWLTLRGDIPDGLVLDHLCRNRACVNPDHLEVVSSRTNVLRGIGPSAVNARKTSCKRGHEFTPENTSIGSKGERLCRTCVLAKSSEWARAKRRAERCTALTRSGERCKNRPVPEKGCRNHGRATA